MLLLLATFAGFTANAQLQIYCPANVIAGTGPSSCDGVVNYPAVTTNMNGMVSDTFFLTGSVQTYTVPPGIDSIVIKCYGAQGATSNDRTPANGSGGLGGLVAGKRAVTNGQVYNIYVGGQGNINGSGGYNGGGAGGVSSAGSSCFGGPAGGGGGASDVRFGGTALSNRIIVAGGGGASGRDYCNGSCQPCGCGGGGGGAGGGIGSPGQAAYNCGFNYPGTGVNFGGGGTLAGGGAAGPGDATGNPGTAGVLGQGGNGGAGSYDVAGGGGGGGYYGGGAGGGAGSGSGVGGGGGGGGSGYLSPSMAPVASTSGVRAGNGIVVIEYTTATATLTQTAGLASGSTFPLGVTTNTYFAQLGSDTASCSFTVTVVDSTPPAIVCGAPITEYVDASCQFALGDYTGQVSATDNCNTSASITQSPLPGTTVSGSGTVVSLVFTASDSSNNTSTCQVSLTLVDTVPPVFTNCPQNIVVTPTTLDCSPVVTWPAPIAADNCGGTSTSSSHTPGTNFGLGTTNVVYSALDSSNNAATCQFTVTVNSPVLDNQVTATPGITACAGDTIALTATPGYIAYNWSTSQSGTSILVTTSGSYWVDLTDSSNCTGRDSIDITFFAAPATPTISQVLDSLCASGGPGTYQWYSNGNLIPGATGACVAAVGGVNFTVVVTNANGCSATSASFMVGIEDPNNADLFSVFPNPAGNQLNVRVSEPVLEPGTIAIYDITGRLVLEQQFREISGTVTLKIADLAEGTFIVELTAGDLKARKQVVHIR